MSLQPTDYALLSQASYNDPEVEARGPSGVKYKRIELDGKWYRPIAHADNPSTGFQATAYECLDSSHEVVIAYRGTEFDREPRQDGKADVAMAVDNVNPQIPDAMAFTRQVVDLAKSNADYGHYPLNVTVTGHSLGGTLAEIAACEYKLRGATFNAYGAAGLMPGIPEGGSDVIDYVRATDVVSAASHHYGTVHEYATQADIVALARHGYHDSVVLNALTPHASVLGRIQGDAHAIDNFVPDSKLLGHSIISPENEKLAQAHHAMIDQYRSEIRTARHVVFVGYQTQKPLIEGAALTIRAGQYAGREAVQAYDAARSTVVQGIHAGEHAVHQAYDAARDGLVAGAHATERALSRAAQVTEHAAEAAAGAAARRASQAFDALDSWFAHETPPIPTVSAPASAPASASASASASPATPVTLDQPAHPDHTLFRQAQAGVHRIDAQIGRTPDQHSDNLAGALTVAAKAKGMARIDAVGAPPDGERASAAQHHAGYSTCVDVHTMTAIHTSLEKSSAAALALSAPTSLKNPYAETQKSPQIMLDPAPGLH